MCGIAGMFSFRGDKRPTSSQVEAMTAAMSQRGPDDWGHWSSDTGNVVLGHRRLSIIDLSPLGHQPMHWQGQRYTIVFNGEIYNYQALRDELESSGRVFRSHSDTEVLLALYERDGEDMCRHLRGMYAFSIYDAEEDSLFLARDPYGIKPLYYSVQDGMLSFGSTCKAVLAAKCCDSSLDPCGVVSFFVWGYVVGPCTIYKGITELPAGHSLRVAAGRVGEPKEFYSLRKTLLDAAETDVRPANMREAFVEAVRDSVKCHLVSDVPVGLFLSAGIDSTSLLAEIVKSGYPVSTLTLGFKEYKDTENDEVPIAERVASFYGTKHRTAWIQGSEFSGDLADILLHMDQPSVDGVNTYLVSKYAREAGFKVAVSGLGGDEILGGYSTFSHVPKIMRTMGWAAKAPWLGRAARRVTRPILSKFTSPKYASLLEYGGSIGGAYTLRRAHFMPDELTGFLDPDLAKAGWSQLQSQQRLDSMADGLDNTHAAISLLESQWYMRYQLLRDSDWASMAHSVELRVPLVDVKLFESVVPYMARGAAPRKEDLVSCLDPAIRGLLLDRPKSGFSIPIRQWLMNENTSNSERSVRSFAKIVGRSFGLDIASNKSASATGPVIEAQLR